MNNPITKVGVVAGVLIKENGKYLLVQEKLPKAYGLWNMPAGHVDEGETIEEAAIREAKEVAGLDIKLIQKLGIYHESVDRPVEHIFAGEIIGGELRFPEDEILDARYFTYEEILAMKDQLRAEWIIDVIGKPKQN